MTSYHKESYGQWAGNPRGKPADLTRCAQGVWEKFKERQCYKKCGHGPEGAFCKIHAKRYEEKPHG